MSFSFGKPIGSHQIFGFNSVSAVVHNNQPSDQDVFCQSLHLNWKLKISQQKTREFYFMRSNFTLVFHPNLCSSILYVFLYGKHPSSIDYRVRTHVVDNKEKQVFEKSYDGPLKHGPIIWSLPREELQVHNDILSDEQVIFEITINIVSVDEYHISPQTVVSANRQDQTKVTENKTVFSDLLVSSLYKLSEDYGKLFNSENFDVVLQCGGQKISVHRIILSARSDVFTAMFRNDMLESKNGVVDITDIKPVILERLIRYIYTGKIDDLSMEVEPLLYEAADKYAVELLKNCCVAFMIENLSDDCACDVLLLAETHGDLDLKDSVATFMAKNREFLRTDMWDKFSEEHTALAVKVYKKFAAP